MAAIQPSKRRLASTSLADKDKALKEIEEGLGRFVTARKYGVAKKQFIER